MTAFIKRRCSLNDNLHLIGVSEDFIPLGNNSVYIDEAVIAAKEKDADDVSQYGIIYILPFLILLFASSVSLVRGEKASYTHSQLAFLSNPINLIVLGSAYIMAAWLFFINFPIFIRQIKRNWLYVVSLFFVLSTACVSAYSLKVVINFIHFIGMMLVVVAAVHYAGDNIRKFFHIMSWFFLLIIILSILTSVFFPSIATYQQLHGEWMGLTSNPNTLGSVAHLAIWFSLVGLYFVPGKLIKMMTFITISGSCVCLYEANCVTSSICAFFILAACPTFMSLKKNTTGKIFLKLFFLILFFILFLLLIYAFFPEKLSLGQAFNAVGRDSSLSGRTYLWARGFQAFLSKPLWGWGYDSNTSIMSKSVIHYGQFHNGYLNVAVAGGSIGFIFLLVLIIKQVNLCFTLRVKYFRTAVAFLVLLLSMMIHDVAEATFFNPTNALWLLFVFSLFYLDYLKAVGGVAENPTNQSVWFG